MLKNVKKLFFTLVLAIGFATPAMACTSGEIDVLGDGTQCETAHFTLTTTSTNSFAFKISARGTFYVDCGNGGTLSGISGKTITRNNTTSTTYTCSWNSSAPQTIKFSGTATEYNTDSSTAAIVFYTDDTNAQKVASITGDLGKIFGAVQSGNIPRFYRTFYQCSNLTSIPSGLFDSIDTSNTTNTSYMFNYTFEGCSSLTGIPSGLFAHIDTSHATNTGGMFTSTFEGCSSLTGIPSGLFNSIDTSASTYTGNMFYGTFSGCSSLTGIPSGLFDSIDTSASTNTTHMFFNTFRDCSNLTSIPSGLFDSINTSASTNTSSMFFNTFFGCASLTSIPSGLFDHINTAASTNTSGMFGQTFSHCSSLTSIPNGLFNHINTSNATDTGYMFMGTFYACSGLTSIPSGLFNSIDTSASTNTTYMFSGTFYACSGLTGTIPSGLFNSIDTSASTNTTYMFSGTFQACSGLTSIPSGLFNSIDTSASTDTSRMFNSTFDNCTGLTSMPTTLFNSNINMANATTTGNMFTAMFYNCSNLTGYILSTTFPSGITTALKASTNVFSGTQLATSCPAGTATYDTYPNDKVSCSVCPAGQYSAAGASSCSNVTAGYFCSGGCKTATPTSNDDCLTGNTCGKCGTDSTTGRPAYSSAGAASCTACPAATQYASRVTSYKIYPDHTKLENCFASFTESDDAGTYIVFCYYDNTDADYGTSNSRCYTKKPTACAAGKYDTIQSTAQWIGGDTEAATCKGVDCMKGKVCTATDAGKYSAEGSTTQSNVSAGYFCSGGCKTATPTSSSDCLTGNTCGKCTTDSTTGRFTYSGAGAASCSVCPEVTGALASRLTGYGGWWQDDIHNSIGGCYVFFSDDDPDATYKTYCSYSISDNAYGGTHGYCQLWPNHITACAAGKYNTIETTSEWDGAHAAICNNGADCMKGKVCTDTDPGKYSAEGSTTQSNVSAGYFCSGGCKTATPTSNDDCLTGNTCGQCFSDPTTGRKTYSSAGAASCSVCPAATGDLASRVKSYSGWWQDNIHNKINGCYGIFTDTDDAGTYNILCYYNSNDGVYGGSDTVCHIYSDQVNACAAGKYKTIESTAQYDSTTGRANCKGIDCMKGKVCTDTDAGYYSPEGDLTQTACPVGTFSPTASAVCYPHKLHIGDDVVYMKSTKQTTPSLNVQIDNNISYANMTTTRTKMNKDSDRYFHIDWGDNHYYLCDDTTCPGGE